MKKLIFKGYDKAPESMVAASELRDCPWAEKGCFKYDTTWRDEGDVTVKFDCKILIDQTLKGDELAKVQRHEQKHFEDFKTVAKRLMNSLQNAINLKKPLDMDNRMQWFDFDVNETSNQYHRTIDGVRAGGRDAALVVAHADAFSARP
jgi:hypothetical protein